MDIRLTDEVQIKPEMISLVNGHSQPCLEYGCPGRPQFEPFVPAPPGHTPNCAKPGQTFCESLDHYPRQLIKFLVDKCSFDFGSVLKDESKEDFNIYREFCSRSVPDYSEGYDYTPRGEPQLHSQALPFLPSRYPLRGQPTLIYGAPSNDTQQSGYRYGAPDQTSRNPFLADETSIKYHPGGHRGSGRPVYPQTQSLNSFGQGQAWWANRTTVCNGICSVPTGYTSKCQQQYVQKRLVALEGSGNQLYTDVFWFPHGCSCQIMLNY
ncbi:hypothetical protein WN55_08945 [Dufourea novaeangliae]|uniref:Spaetzle domain-containing protein n=1 Tax=Dufourea novaeangliae TaxID=178035 RepID=A0A154P5D4_DUFNO|nr:hypothetical protein WN55_08945 [Dufourea novaeangliae]